MIYYLAHASRVSFFFLILFFSDDGFFNRRGLGSSSHCCFLAGNVGKGGIFHLDLLARILVGRKREGFSSFGGYFVIIQGGFRKAR